jgi:hypothetical protein
LDFMESTSFWGISSRLFRPTGGLRNGDCS